MWGTHWRQRFRLAPLYLSLRIADRVRTRRPSNAFSDRHTRRQSTVNDWAPGISVVIPERDSPQLLAEALTSLLAAIANIDEPSQVIVVASGAPRQRYASICARFQGIELIHCDAPLSFGEAISRGLARARHDWTYLMNNDMMLEPNALAELLPRRATEVFSISSQIFQRNEAGRREETGFTDWYIDRSGLRVFHAPPIDDHNVSEHLAGSGGATLYRTRVLAHYAAQSRCYDPFYWEDIEWGVRAWRDGLAVLFCPTSHGLHRHRATTSRFYSADELDRIVERNRFLFDARHRATPFGIEWLMNRICDLPYDSQREMAAASIAASTFRSRLRTNRSPDVPRPPILADPRQDSVEIAASSFSYRLRRFDATSARQRLLLVTPFAVFPPRHGGARRIAGLLAHLRRDYDVVLVSDEAMLYDSRSFAFFRDLCAVHLVWRVDEAVSDTAQSLDERARAHTHAALRGCVRRALEAYRPTIVQIEYAELAELIDLRHERERWLLGLHDAVDESDFSSPQAARRFAEVLQRFDSVTVCSAEDATLVAHRATTCVPNASSIALGDYRPSDSSQIVFMGPFRYRQNLHGIRAFLRDAFPVIVSSVPSVTLRILGGENAREIARTDPLFAQADVEVLDHRDDVSEMLARCALTINPLSGIRGSSIKVIESLTAGRICVSTLDGARGFVDCGVEGLIVADDVPSMIEPIIELLRDCTKRHRLEMPDEAKLAPYQWAHSAALQRALYDRLTATPKRRYETADD